MIKKNDVVKFNENTIHTAAIWCKEHDIPGVVIEEFTISSKGTDIWKVRTVLDYPIWVPGKHMDKITNTDFAPLPEES